MDYLQYLHAEMEAQSIIGFKPYYKWITFNTKLIFSFSSKFNFISFKPYYKWITFNTIYLKF